MLPANDLKLAKKGANKINFFSFLYIEIPKGRLDKNSSKKDDKKRGFIKDRGIDKNEKLDKTNWI